MRKQYILEELDCAHCAMEMEEAARKIPGVQFVSVNFLSMRLTLEAADEDYERVFRQVVKACRRVEPDCRILTKKYRMGGEEKKELIRIVAAAGLFLVVKLLEVFGVLEEGHWLTLLLYLPAYALAGYEVVWKALRGLFRGRVFDENFLMTLATVGAVATGEYSEAVAVMVLYQIGEFLQDLAVSKSRRSVTELMDIRPDSAHLLKDGREMTVKPEDVPVGSLIVIRPGEKVPLDGEVVEGRSFLDTAALTGESVPREILAGQKITSGCVNMRGVLTVKTEKSFGESSVSRILALIEDGADTKSHAEKFISRFAKWYTPVVVFGALILAVAPPLILGAGDGEVWKTWLHKAITCLVISCPCALVISVPLAFFGGIGGAGRRGILIKGAESVEKLARAGSCAFDKTGTLTRGVFKVTAIHPDEVSEEQLLELAATCENYSDHPVSQSLKAAFDREIDRGRIGPIEEIAGEGVHAQIDGEDVFVGNTRLMERAGAAVHPCEKCRHEGTVVHVSRGDQYLGHIVISDELKPDAAEAVADLKNLGLTDLYLFSGDEKEIAREVGRTLGIDKVEAELTPEDKLRLVEKIRAEKKDGAPLIFVGDGINDVPVLARADVGVAMGGIGADAAIEAADVVLMDDKPGKVGVGVRIARKTRAIVWENVVFSIGVKLAVLIPNVALGESSVPLWLAVFADVGVCLLAVLNSARALRVRNKAN